MRFRPKITTFFVSQKTIHNLIYKGLQKWKPVSDTQVSATTKLRGTNTPMHVLKT